MRRLQAVREDVESSRGSDWQVSWARSLRVPSHRFLIEPARCPILPASGRLHSFPPHDHCKCGSLPASTPRPLHSTPTAASFDSFLSSLSSSTLQEMISHLRLAMNTVLRTRAAISVLARVLSERDWYLGRVLSQFGLVLQYSSFIASLPS